MPSSGHWDTPLPWPCLQILENQHLTGEKQHGHDFQRLLTDLALRMNLVSCVPRLSSRAESHKSAKKWAFLICSKLLKDLKYFFLWIQSSSQSILKNLRTLSTII